MDTQINEPTNQNSQKHQRKRYWKTLETSVINSPMSIYSLSLCEPLLQKCSKNVSMSSNRILYFKVILQQNIKICFDLKINFLLNKVWHSGVKVRVSFLLISELGLYWCFILVFTVLFLLDFLEMVFKKAAFKNSKIINVCLSFFLHVIILCIFI